MERWHPRNLIGYGRHSPDPQWPGKARLALQFVLNVEEGAERTVLNGDSVSENHLPELAGTRQYEGQRNYSAESLFDYGARVGFWRILWLFESDQRRDTKYRHEHRQLRVSKLCQHYKRNYWKQRFQNRGFCFLPLHECDQC